MIEASVFLPLWRSAPIIRVCLESLCEQVDAPPWELLVVEERGEGAVEPEVWEEYGPRLTAAGCESMIHNRLVDHVPCTRKFGLASGMVSLSSEVVLFTAGDEYQYPDRIRRALDRYRERDFHAMYDRYAVFVHLARRQALLFDQVQYPKPYGTQLVMAGETFRQIPIADASWPDAWIWSTMLELEPEFRPYIADDESYRRGASLEWGENLCDRERQYDEPSGPFSRLDYASIWLPDWLRDVDPPRPGASLRRPRGDGNDGS